MKAKLLTLVDIMARAITGDDGTDRHGTPSAIWDALGFFVLVGCACGLVSLYALFTGAW